MIHFSIQLDPNDELSVINVNESVRVTSRLPQQCLVKDLEKNKQPEILVASILFEGGESPGVGYITIQHPHWFPGGELKKIVSITFEGLCSSVVLHSAFLRDWMTPEQTNYSHQKMAVVAEYDDRTREAAQWADKRDPTPFLLHVKDGVVTKPNLTYPIGDGWKVGFNKERGHLQITHGGTIMIEIALSYAGKGKVSIELFPD